MLSIRPTFNLCECVQDGISTKFGIGDRKWCCKTTKDKCIRARPDWAYEFSDLDGFNITCNGTALSLSDQCHNENYDGPSCNYYPLDQYRYSYDGIYRSTIDLCQDRYVNIAKTVLQRSLLQKYP